MRIASLNIAKRYGVGALAEMTRQPDLRKADVLLLQEVVDGANGHMAADLATALGFHFVFAPAFQLDPNFVEGLAILSRYPLRDRSVLDLPHNQLLWHTRIRIALAATAATPWGPMRIINTHLDNRINANEKRLQLEILFKESGRAGGPCVIGGDFNNANFYWISGTVPIPGSQDLREMVDQEMQRHGFRTPLGSGPGSLHFLGLKLDWIYLRGLRALGSGVTPISFSDHNSVWVLAGP